MKKLLGLMFMLLIPNISMATGPTDPMVAINTAWVLLAAFLVFFMQAGFNMVEVGLLRAKNASSVLTKNLLVYCIACIGFFIFGYAIMFGGSGPLFGTRGWFLIGAESSAGLPLYAFWMFHLAFCGATTTLSAGGMAERMKFPAYLIYSFLFAAFIYPIIGHWAWGGGWLAKLNFHDFAGSAVVHTGGGTVVLVGTLLLGPRAGKFNRDGSPNSIAGHNIPLVPLGMFLLWFGWFGFNPGSALGMNDPGLVARVVVNTNLAAATGVIAAMITAWAKFGKPDLTLTLNGALAGLVAITAPCAVVSPGASIYIGAIAGVICVFGVRLLDRLRIDDPIGAIAVHWLNGIWGTLAVGLFCQVALTGPRNGLFYGGGFSQLGIQTLGNLTICLFVAASMGMILKTIDALIGLRVTEEEELRGLDISEHGMESYSGFEIFTTQ
jgi:Amt family ammonium transporter